MKNVSITKVIAEIGIFAAIGFVLDEIQGAYSVSFVNGGSIGIAMIAVLIMAYRRGWWPAIVTGLVIGAFDLATKAYIYHPAQVLLDYILPYALVGCAGFLKPLFDKTDDKQIKIIWLIVGAVLGGLLKFLSHFLSGVIFFSDAAGFAWNLNYMQPALYSFVYNIAYIGPSIILCAALLVILFLKAQKIVMTEGESVTYVENVEKRRKTNNYIFSSLEIVSGAFLFIYFLIKYISSYTYKDKVEYIKVAFDKNCMLIFILGLFLMLFGLFQLYTVYKNTFKYRIAFLVVGTLVMIFSVYGLARLLEMYLDQWTEINNLYWAWFIPSFVVASGFITLFFITRNKKAEQSAI